MASSYPASGLLRWRRNDRGSIGGYGTSGCSDPHEDMVAIVMTRRVWHSPAAPAVHLDFWTSAYQAIDD
jgi:hypothetical protein